MQRGAAVENGAPAGVLLQTGEVEKNCGFIEDIQGPEQAGEVEAWVALVEADELARHAGGHAGDLLGGDFEQVGDHLLEVGGVGDVARAGRRDGLDAPRAAPEERARRVARPAAGGAGVDHVGHLVGVELRHLEEELALVGGLGPAAFNGLREEEGAGAAAVDLVAEFAVDALKIAAVGHGALQLALQLAEGHAAVLKSLGLQRDEFPAAADDLGGDEQRGAGERGGEGMEEEARRQMAVGRGAQGRFERKGRAHHQPRIGVAGIAEEGELLSALHKALHEGRMGYG